MCSFISRMFVLIVGILFSTSSAVAADPSAKPWEVKRNQRVELLVSEQAPVRSRDPVNFFGFSTLWFEVGQKLWDEPARAVRKEVSTLLRPFSGANYRYPGGLEANTFVWDAAVGERSGRALQQPVEWQKPVPAVFGVPEFLEFAKSVQGRPLFVANLHGRMGREESIEQLAATSAQMATLFKSSMGNADRVWELGNELERGRYRWSPGKYIQRATVVANEIKKADPGAKFLVPLLEYQPNDQVPKSVYNRTVATSFRDAYGFSMHLYYDGKPVPSVATIVANVVSAIQDTRISIDRQPRFWITEHGRWPQGQPEDKNWEKEWYRATNVGAALGVADFMIAMSQLKEIESVTMHALLSPPWGAIWHNKDRTVFGTPVYWVLRALRDEVAGFPVETISLSTNLSGYSGGYDVRGTAFADEAGIRSVWLVNRAGREIEVAIKSSKPISARGPVLGAVFKSVGGEPDDPNATHSYQQGVQVGTAENSGGAIALIRIPAFAVVHARFRPNSLP